MNVLMVTSDVDVLHDGSAAQSLLKEQATITNRLMVVVMNGHSAWSAPRKVSDSLWLLPTNSWAPFLQIFDALYIVRHEIFFQNHLQADMIVANDPVGAGVAGYWIASRYKKPFHVHVGRNLFAPSYLGLSLWHWSRSVLARIVVGRAYTVSVRDEKTREALVRMDARFADRTTVVPRYIDVAAIQTKEIAPADDLHLKYTQFRAIMLVVAPLDRDQNIELAIQSLTEVSKFYHHIGLVIVGDGPRKGSLKSYAQKLGVADSVIFEPMRDDLISYYKSAHLLMVPSPHDAYETVIEDAAASGCAIVSSSVGIAPIIIEHEKSGFLCDPKVPSGFWNAADALIRNTPLWTEVKKNISPAIQAYMSKDKGEHLNLYRTAWESSMRLSRGL